jgi:hypothetical protein
VDFVHEEDIHIVQIGQQRRQIPRFFNGGAGSDAYIDAHLVGDHPGQRRFAQTRRAVEQDVIQRLAALFGRLDPNGQVVF